jgi:hypothetical protein
MSDIIPNRGSGVRSFYLKYLFDFLKSPRKKILDSRLGGNVTIDTDNDYHGTVYPLSGAKTCEHISVLWC